MLTALAVCLVLREQAVIPPQSQDLIEVLTAALYAR